MIDIEDNLPDPDLPDAVIFDLDGTLALLNGRDPHNYADCYYDSLNHPIYRLYRYYKKNNFKILLVTGRNGEAFDDTLKWLEKNDIQPDKMYMKAIGDKRPDTIFKLAMYKAFIEDKYNIEAIYEDRSRMVRAWRSQGLLCLQVSEGDY